MVGKLKSEETPLISLSSQRSQEITAATLTTAQDVSKRKIVRDHGTVNPTTVKNPTVDLKHKRAKSSMSSRVS